MEVLAGAWLRSSSFKLQTQSRNEARARTHAPFQFGLGFCRRCTRRAHPAQMLGLSRAYQLLFDLQMN